MFEVSTSDEFANWFAALDDAAAEEVAQALDLVVALGAALAPAESSPLLLWFDADHEGRTEALGQFHDLNGMLDRARQVSELEHAIVKQLESPAFARRLARLAPARAAELLGGVERLRASMRAARVLLAMAEGFRQSAQYPRGASVLGAARSRSANLEALSAALDLAALPGAGTRGVQERYAEVLRLIGLDHRMLADSESGLRELTLQHRQPRLRVLYGIDVPRRRAHVILGEALTRRYYGDSVRRAEQAFREFLAGANAEQPWGPRA